MSQTVETARFLIKANALFGANAASQVPDKIRELGFRNAGVIVDETVAAQEPYQSLVSSWKQKGFEPGAVYLSRTGVEPDYDYLDLVAKEFRSLDLDILIGIGGGSTLDLAKGVGILMKNPGAGITYRGMNLVPSPGVSVVVIPSVAGSGSEVSETASFIDHRTRTKLGINGRHVGCYLAVLDPVLLKTCPASVTAGSGLDAMVHATEAVTAKTANHVSTLFGAEAIRLLFTSLPTAIAQPADLAARGDLLLASFYAGLAMSHAAGGPASGISYPLGVHYNVPHGYAGGLLLPHVVAANLAKGYVAGYARLADRLGIPSPRPEMGDKDRATAFCDAMFNLCKQIGAPANFRRWKVGREAIKQLVELTLSQRKANLELNPVAFGKEDVEAVLSAVLN